MLTRKETIKEFNRLKKESGFDVIVAGDVEGWCTSESWIDWLNEMEGITKGEVNFGIDNLPKDNEVIIQIKINDTIPMEIKNPDDNFDETIIDQINEHLTSLGITKSFQLVLPEGYLYYDDACIFMTYINDEDYAKLTSIGCAGGYPDYDTEMDE